MGDPKFIIWKPVKRSGDLGFQLYSYSKIKFVRQYVPDTVYTREGGDIDLFIKIVPKV